MSETSLAEINELKTKSLKELKERYAELFEGEKPSSNNKVLLWRRLSYRIQELDQGGLSEESKTKIDELIEKYDPVNNTSIRPTDSPTEATKKEKSRDRRLPIPGSIITKEYKGKHFEIKVLDKAFEMDGKQYKSLSAIAIALTGAHWNGYLFFNL